MTTTLGGCCLYKGSDDFVQFDITVDGLTRKCLIDRDTLNDLSGSDSSGIAILEEFKEHRETIKHVAELAIRGGLAGDPLHLPIKMFFPLNPLPKKK